jgi:hypothetical protein
MSVCVGKQRHGESKYHREEADLLKGKVTRMSALLLYISNLPFIFLFADWLLTCENKSCKSAKRGERWREKLQEQSGVLYSLSLLLQLCLCVSLERT